jgi:hypothetical protein
MRRRPEAKFRVGYKFLRGLEDPPPRSDGSPFWHQIKLSCEPTPAIWAGVAANQDSKSHAVTVMMFDDFF